MKKTIKFLLPALMGAVVLAGLSRHVAQAQLDPGALFYLLEKSPLGQDMKVGEVYVHDRTPGQTQYVEEWVLYPNYRYPGLEFMGMLNVAASPMERPYSSPADFHENVPFAAGSKYIRVTAQEYTSLPVAR